MWFKSFRDKQLKVVQKQALPAQCDVFESRPELGEKGSMHSLHNVGQETTPQRGAEASTACIMLVKRQHLNVVQKQAQPA